MNIHLVQVCGLSRSSENRIHDDAAARRFGFKGAQVRHTAIDRPRQAA